MAALLTVDRRIVRGVPRTSGTSVEIGVIVSVVANNPVLGFLFERTLTDTSFTPAHE